MSEAGFDLKSTVMNGDSLNLGGVIKVTGLVLGIITFSVGVFVFFSLCSSYSTNDFAWIGIMLAFSGILEGVLLAGFGQLIDDVCAIKGRICCNTPTYSNSLPNL